MDNNIITFNSYNEHFMLSNMFPVMITYKDMRFFGVDHLYHYLLYFQHPEIQKQIMKKAKGICANYQAKQISERNVELISNISQQQKRNLLKKCMMLKYEQSQHCKDYLLSTGDKELIEFAFWGDTYFGCILQDGKFEGENQTGKILQEIRQELLR